MKLRPPGLGTVLESLAALLGATLSEDGQDAEGGDGGGARPNDRSSRDVR